MTALSFLWLMVATLGTCAVWVYFVQDEWDDGDWA